MKMMVSLLNMKEANDPGKELRLSAIIPVLTL